METKFSTVRSKKLPCPPSKRTYNKLSCCLKPVNPPKTPDPGTYSQYERYQNGQSISWDSPDITTNRDASSSLDDEVVVKVRNYSAEAPAAGVYVKVAYSRFGIGFPREVLNILQTDLNKRGLPGDLSELRFPFPQQVKEEFGNISTFVTIEHPYDRATMNNKGEQSWSASRALVGANHLFQFPIYNSLNAAETFSLRLLESDWSSTLSTNSINLLPGQSANISLVVIPPADAAGGPPKAFNVAAFRSNGALYGGIFHRVSV